MRMVDLIAQKRDGGELSTGEIAYFLNGTAAGDIPDYQAAALLMAIYIRGMSRRETVDLTLAMAESGQTLSLHDIAPYVIDKHSSGGVGDKTSLVVLPLVAACGVPVGKMSGRGLGSSGGTLDKMESFDGWSPNLSLAQFKQQLGDIDLVLAGQTGDLAPADGKLYALRDVTGTVSNKSLIAASIMAKKLAAGADGIVLDVKVGSGAFMPTVADATELAQLMVDIGEDAGRDVVALVSDMNEPLGSAIGNALEVKEAIAALQGGGPDDLWRHCLEVAAYMILLPGAAGTLDEARTMITAARDDGRGLAKFREMIVAQGGDGDQLDHPDRLPRAPIVEPIPAPRAGYLAGMDTGAIGWAAVNLGCGRLVKADAVNPAPGFVLPAKVGQWVEAGQPLGEVHAMNEADAAEGVEAVAGAMHWSDEPVEPLPLFYAVVGDNNRDTLRG